MDLDDLEPRKQNAKPKDLSAYSVEELKAYIEMLKAEILRVEATLKQKSAHMDVAATLFKK